MTPAKEKPLKFLVSFVDDWFTRLAWWHERAFGSYGVKIQADGIPEMVNQLKAALSKQTSQTAKAVIKSITITGHGSPGEIGYLTTRLSVNGYDGKVPQNSSVEWQRLSECHGLWASDNDGIELRACSTAAENQGKTFLKALADTLGVNARGWDGTYEIHATGKEWTATPGGNLCMTANTGRRAFLLDDFNALAANYSGKGGVIRMMIPGKVAIDLTTIGIHAMGRYLKIW